MAYTTIYDVAGAAKVSLATVSRVMNNPDKVNPETRERVLRVIKELGYRPNAIARGLASRKTTTVGIVMSDVTRASTSQLLGGIVDIARRYNYSIKIFSMAGESDVLDSIRTVVAEQVDGIIFLNDELDKRQMDLIMNYIKESGIPVVLANVIYDDEEVPSVIVDYKEAVYEVTKAMIEAGRKNIYCLSTVRHYSVNTKKEEGYAQAMEEANLKPNIFRTSGDLDINRLHFEEFFKHNQVDGAIGVRDSISVSFMNSCTKLGMKVPEQVMVCGMQNTKYAILSRPTLTCIDTPVYDIGAVSMRLLTKYMQHEEIENHKVVLPHKVIKRESM